MSVKLALFQPDIPQNAGAILRLTACFGVPLEIIEPCGFVWSDRKLRRVGLDYANVAHVKRHNSWEAFLNTLSGRLILLTTRGTENYTRIAFKKGDVLLLGRETAGVPIHVHKSADRKIYIPITPMTRSLNVAIAGSIVLGEALRQLNGFPNQGMNN